MDDLIARVEQLVGRRPPPRSVVGEAVDLALAGQEPALVAAAYCCAVPRRLDPALCIALLGEGPPGAAELLPRLLALPICDQSAQGPAAYRAGVREHLLSGLRSHDRPLLIDLHRRAYAHLAARTGDLPPAGDAEALARAAPALIERVYHGIYAEPERGFAELDELGVAAYLAQLRGDPALLTALRGPTPADQPPTAWLQLEYYEALPGYARRDHPRLEAQIRQLLGAGAAGAARAWAEARLGAAAMALGRLDDAAGALQRSKAIWDALGAGQQSAAAQHDLGAVLLARNELPQAERHLRAALGLFAAAGSQAGQGLALNSLGNLHMRREQWPAALDAYEQSLRIREAGGDPVGVATCLTNLGLCRQRMGDRELGRGGARRQYEQAAGFYRRAADLFRQLGLRLNLARALYLLALSHHQLDDPGPARAWIGEAVAIFSELGAAELARAEALAKLIGGRR